MITSLYAYVQPHLSEDYKIKNIKQLLFDVGATNHFESIYSDYGESAENVITFLILAYSSDSPMVSAGEDFTETEKRILGLVKINPELWDDFIFLKRQSIKTAILYLSKEVKDWRYNQLLVWKKSCQILDQIATTQPDTKNKNASSNIGNANKFSFEIKRKIADLEKEILQTSKSQQRLTKINNIDIERMSMESLLKEISKS